MSTILKKGYSSFNFVLSLCFILQLFCIKNSMGSSHANSGSVYPSGELFVYNIGLQQTGRVSGNVTNSNGNPISGATISVPALGISTSSNSAGRYSLELPSGEHTLKVSFISFASQERKVTVSPGSTQEVNISLLENSDDIDEVVVVGYGTSKKTDVTGSTSTISTKQFENAPATRIDQLLQGQASGVDVKSTNGAPGAPTTIRIRGSRSITATNEPIYVIDGIVDPSGTSLNSINPSDIESINILKDASTTAIYGSRASNGVILVTTKKGVAGRDIVRISTNQGFSQLPRKLDLMNAREFAEFINEALVFGNKPPLYPNIDSLINKIGDGTDWIDAVTETAPFSSYDASASGGAGGDRGYTYFISANLLDQNGIIKNTGFKRYQGRINLTKKFGSRINMGVSTNISREQHKISSLNFGTNTGWSSSFIFLPPTMPIYKEDGSYETYNPIWYTGGHINNPVAVLDKVKNERAINNILTNAYLEFELLKDLKLKSTLGINFINQRGNYYSPTDMPQNVFNNTLFGSANSDIYNTLGLINENTLNFKRSFGEHTLDLLAGTSYQTKRVDRLYGAGSNLTNDITQYNNLGLTELQFRGLASGLDENTIISFLGRANYNYGGRYYLTLTGRADGASNFAMGKKWGIFPSGAAKWRISEESFFKESEIKEIISELAVRASYGISGNQGIANYQSLASLPSNPNSYIFGGQQTLGYTQGNLANKDLSWETTAQFDAGLDMHFFNGRINFTADYYDMKSRDLLLTVQLPSQTGYTSRLINLGRSQTKGFDFSLSGEVLHKGDFSWQANLNVSTNSQQVTDIGPLSKVFLDAGIGYGVTTSYLQKGYPIGGNFGLEYVGTWKNQQEIDAELAKPIEEREFVSHNSHYLPGGQKYRDYSPDGQININDYHYLGQANPKVFGGIGSSFNYKRLSMDVFFQFSQGAKMYNAMEFFNGSGSSLTNQFHYFVNRWSPENPTSEIPKVESRDNIASTRLLQDASFIRFKSAQIRYSLGGLILPHIIKDMDVFASGTNLFLWTKYRGFDPEVNSSGGSSTIIANDNGNYPNGRVITFGVNLTL